MPTHERGFDEDLLTENLEGIEGEQFCYSLRGASLRRTHSTPSLCSVAQGRVSEGGCLRMVGCPQIACSGSMTNAYFLWSAKILRAGRRDWRDEGDGADRASVSLKNGVPDYIVGFGHLRESNDDSTGTDYAGFFSGNFGDGITQKFLVIERNVGDHTQERLDHIGCVQAAAHPDLEDRDLDFAGGEVLERNGREHFKKAGMPGQLALFDQPLGGALDE